MVSQNRLAARSFFLVGGDDFWDSNQGKDKGIDGKTFKNEVFCDKQADNKVVNGAV